MPAKSFMVVWSAGNSRPIAAELKARVVGINKCKSVVSIAVILDSKQPSNRQQKATRNIKRETRSYETF